MDVLTDHGAWYMVPRERGAGAGEKADCNSLSMMFDVTAAKTLRPKCPGPRGDASRLCG